MTKGAQALPELDDSNWQVYSRLLAYLKPLKFFFALSIVGNLIYAGSSAYMVKALEFVIETIETRGLAPKDTIQMRADFVFSAFANLMAAFAFGEHCFPGLGITQVFGCVGR